MDNLFCKLNAKQYDALKAEGAQFSYNYASLTGPTFWHCLESTCKGNRQSPININTLTLQKGENLKALNITGLDTKISKVKLSNEGSVSVELEFDGARPKLSGGNLENEFTFYSSHWHWGVTDWTGSEHFINGQSYALENHLIFANLEKYGTFENCLKAGDGLAVLGILFRADNNAPNMPLFSSVQNVRSYNTVHTISNSGITFGEFIGPRQFPVAYYEGGLTTPPCFEVVQWHVCLDVQKINRNQLQIFRSLTGKNGAPYSGNWRAPQPLANRKVFLTAFGKNNV